MTPFLYKILEDTKQFAMTEQVSGEGQREGWTAEGHEEAGW